ncbi:hypothetical protein [Ornithinimicrobium sp. INDO-MA30-4]|nr:hypothetical protein [Ornithinimicrobium sp. INDO-MA30-4]
MRVVDDGEFVFAGEVVPDVSIVDGCSVAVGVGVLNEEGDGDGVA